MLVKGPETALADVQADWDEEENLIDSNLAFYDLKHLQHRNYEFAYPTFDSLSKDPVQLPSKGDVINYLHGGNDIVIRLPNTSKFHLEGEDHDGNEEWFEFNPFAWLPIGVGLNEEKSGDLVTAEPEWEWYFDDDFHWETVLQLGAAIRNTGSGYHDPRPPKSGPAPKSRSMPPPSAYFPSPSIQELASNNVNGLLAATVKFRSERPINGGFKESDGQIYFLPPHPSRDSGEFIRGILEREYGFDVEHQPDWVEHYALPNEDEFRNRIEQIEMEISDIESGVQEARRYRSILFEGDDELEEMVPEVLRRLGLDVDGEVPGGRDGAIKLEDQTFILEITGQSDGVDHQKIRQLEDHLDDTASEGYGTNRTGLLIFNHFKYRDPTNRQLTTANFKDRLEKRDCKLLTTVDLYQILCDYEREEIDTEHVVGMLTSGDTIIRANNPLCQSAGQTESRLGRLRRRLSEIM
ncbi:hypothetical protein [Haloferax profundi]|uniref:hypothetical protein n=1 Tax=Haloferax profundi TaxID=1544718 RepID=UPI0007337C15|nr:hypothetical protein [Haloferax profundi]